MATRLNIRCFRKGMTLVELLVVVAIMTLLMAVAIPMIRPAFRDRQLREASRQVNTFFAGAKARAAETGRAVGVWIEVSTDDKFAARLYMAEVAPSFTGAILGARCTVNSNSKLRFWTPWSSGGQTINNDTWDLLRRLTPPNENTFFIRFDHKGPLYRCRNDGVSAPSEDPPWTADFNFLPSILPHGTDDPGGDFTPVGSRPVGQTFEITRGPSKSIVSPLLLPGDAVIDLSVSGVGVGSGANVFNGASLGGQVIIMFTPSGRMGAVYVDTTEIPAVESVYLLIGRRSKVISPAQAASTVDLELNNLADPANLWVTINNRTGAITTEDNAATSAATTVAARIKLAREFARGSRQKGGR